MECSFEPVKRTVYTINQCSRSCKWNQRLHLSLRRTLRSKLVVFEAGSKVYSCFPHLPRTFRHRLFYDDLQQNIPTAMTSNGFHGYWPQNYAHGGFQSNPHGQASSQPCNQINSTAASNIPPLFAGYVHSGYQAAIQGNSPHVNQALQPDFRPQHSPFMQNGTNYVPNIFARPPRLGPGGPVRCSYPGCEYSGYAKGVEIHKMDRHLIFPPGYKPSKSAPDADVGLVFLRHFFVLLLMTCRPNATIPGTGISLNTPEAIEAWIAERKKNWPTASRIAEKACCTAAI